MDISENVMAETTPERGNELKAILFKFLLEEYAHQNEYLITLLELFLVHFYHSNDDMKDFIQVLIKEATGHLEGKLLEDEKLDWYFSMTNNQKKFYRLETRARYFKNLSKSINQLYDLIRNSLTLQSDQFLHVQYSYLPLNRDNYEIIRQFATSVKREDYFLIGLVSLAYQKASDRGYTFSMLIDTLSESVGAHLVKDKKDQKTEHHLMLKYIEERLKSKTRDITNCNSSVKLVKTFDTFGRKMKQLILNILKEYHAQDNPFRCSSIITTHSAVRLSVTELASDISLEKLCIKETENTLLTDNFQVDIHSTTSPTASSTAPIARSEDGAARKKRLEEKLKALLGLGSTRPQEPMKPILQDFLPMTAGSIKFSSEPKAAGSSTSTKQIMQRPEEPLKAILANLCKGQQFSFSKREAVLFFRSKELQFNSVVDCVVGNKGVREYSAEGDENNILAAGVLTCLLHAIRLLFVDRVLDASPSNDGQYGRYQELLTIMVSKMKSWKVAEVIKGLNLDSSLAEMHCFESFIKKFREVHRGLFTVLPTIQWSSFLDLKSQQSIVQDLYLKGIQRSKDPFNCIFFLSISGTPPPSTPSIPLPYLFHCRTMPSGEVDPDSATLQLVGLIYCCAKGEYSFSFITYARCREYGQYEVFIKKQAEDVRPSHFVPYAQVDRVTRKVTYPPPCPVFARDSEKRPLVGIILVRNNMQSDADPRFLAQPIIRVINGSNITSSMMRSLDDPGAWLVDELVHGPIYLMFDHLSKSSPGFAHGNRMYICNSWTFEKHINGGYNISLNLQANFKDCDFNLYIINLGNSHWLCACAPMNASLSQKEKKIYFLDSMNDTATAIHKGRLLVKFFEDKLQLPGYKPVLLPSSSQNNDGCTCGLFTILNATLVLKSISQGSFNPHELQRRTPRDFTSKEKFEMRQSVQRILHGTEDVSSFLSWV